MSSVLLSTDVAFPDAEMKRKVVWLAASLVALVSGPTQASERVALVVGNADYSHAPALANPRNDAADIAAALAEVGFSVETALDVDRGDFGGKFSDFARRTQGARAALFYYAGHGMQVDGENYLLPVDAELTDETQLGFQAVRLRDVLNGMRSGTNLVFLDACRDNPFARKVAATMGARSSAVGRGLAPVERRSVRGTFIAYATAEGDIASDGTGRNSPFTAALKQHIATPGLTIGQVMTRVRGELAALHQEPWNTSSLKVDFYFVSPSRPDAKQDSPSLVGEPPDPATEMWLQIRGQNDVRILERFLSEYPDNPYRLPAEARLAALRQQTTPNGKERLRGCGWCPELVEIPAGQFRMGDLTGTGEENEKPVRLVRIPRFALARHETTVGQFRRFVMATGYRTEAEQENEKGCRTWEIGARNKWDWTPGRSWRSLEYALEEDQPVVCVSWHDAQAYVRWLNEQTDGGWRLPSEAEWEYTARGGAERLYHFGDDPSRLCDYGNVADTTKLPNGSVWTHKAECSDGAVYPTRVGSYQPNALGLQDIHGNVWEWVEDCYGSYTRVPTNGNAWDSRGCSVRVLRGGGFFSKPSELRLVRRLSYIEADRDMDLGFRVARTLVP